MDEFVKSYGKKPSVRVLNLGNQRRDISGGTTPHVGVGLLLFPSCWNQLVRGGGFIVRSCKQTMSELLLGIIIGASLRGGKKARRRGSCKRVKLKGPVGPPPPTPQPGTHSLRKRANEDEG